MPFVHADAVAVLDRTADLVDVAEVDLRVYALRVEVQPERDQVDVAGAFPVAEQASLDAIGAGQHGELRVGDGRPAVVVRMDGQRYEFAAGQIA